jgi:hypothetical protein
MTIKELFSSTLTRLTHPQIAKSPLQNLVILMKCSRSSDGSSRHDVPRVTLIPTVSSFLTIVSSLSIVPSGFYDTMTLALTH